MNIVSRSCLRRIPLLQCEERRMAKGLVGPVNTPSAVAMDAKHGNPWHAWASVYIHLVTFARQRRDFRAEEANTNAMTCRSGSALGARQTAESAGERVRIKGRMAGNENKVLGFATRASFPHVRLAGRQGPKTSTSIQHRSFQRGLVSRARIHAATLFHF